MAELRFDLFARALRDRLAAQGLSLSAAALAWPDTDKAMLSRALAGRRLSPANLLLVCERAGLDPYAFLERRPPRRPPRRQLTLKRPVERAVTQAAPRETPTAPGAGARPVEPREERP